MLPLSQTYFFRVFQKPHKDIQGYQLTTVFSAKYQLTVNPIRTLWKVDGDNDECILESGKDKGTPKVKRLVLLKMNNKGFIYYINQKNFSCKSKLEIPEISKRSGKLS